MSDYGSTCERTRARARALAVKHVSLDGRVCERCGAERHLRRHHADYTKPLEIEVLCQKCHAKEHRQGHWNVGWADPRRKKWAAFYRRYADGEIGLAEVQAFARANGTTTERVWVDFRAVYGTLADYRRRKSERRAS